jgi:alpha-D-xyloside xylohydrolase
VDYYLPAGRWTNFLTGEVVEGGRWRREQHDFLSLPLMVRPGAAIVVGNEAERPDYAYGEEFTLQVYQLADGNTATAVIPAADGTPAVRFTVERSGRDVGVTWQGEPKRWQLLLVGVPSATGATGGTVENTAQGVRVTPAPGASALTVSLPAS